MTEYKINFPAAWNCRVSGSVVDSVDPADLSEDMLEVSLPSGILVCAGWEPATGQYLVSVVKGLEDIIPPQVERDADSVIQTVGDLVDEYRSPAPLHYRAISNTTATDMAVFAPFGQGRLVNA